MKSQFNAKDIGALASDCGLKTWQLRKIFKHFRKVTGCKVNSVPIQKALKELSKDVVQPQTGKYEHQYKDEDGNLKKETVEWEYQSIAEVYKRIIVALMTEHDVNPEDVERLFIIFGGNHGVGALCMPFRTVLVLNDGRHLKKDISIVATINCKKDTGEVIMKTIMDMLTADLKLINDSSVALSIDDSGVLQCDLVPKESTTLSSTNTIKDTSLYITGDIKWFCMLLGMEDMASHWCIYCLHRAQDWKKKGHCPAADRTIENIVETVEKYKLTDQLKSNAEHLGVKAKPFWDFIPIDNYWLSLLHIWMGIFNDIDRWFMEQVHLLMDCSEREVAVRASMPALTAKKMN